MNSHSPSPLARAAVAAVAGLALLSLGACTENGGDTTCKDYLGLSQQDQTEQATRLYRDKHGNDPTAVEAVAIREEASAYCKTAGRADSRIKEIPLS